jgi:hypothetical protein
MDLERGWDVGWGGLRADTYTRRQCLVFPSIVSTLPSAAILPSLEILSSSPAVIYYFLILNGNTRHVGFSQVAKTTFR